MDSLTQSISMKTEEDHILVSIFDPVESSREEYSKVCDLLLEAGIRSLLDVKRSLSNEFARPICFLAKLSDEIVGVSVGFVCASHLTMEIALIIVTEKFRRIGVGRALCLSMANAYAKSQVCFGNSTEWKILSDKTKIECICMFVETNEVFAKFLYSIGFSLVRTQRDAFGDKDGYVFSDLTRLP